MVNNWKIDPVRAVCKKYQGKDHGIQALNNDCYNICTNFSFTNDPYEADPQCLKSCKDFIEKRKVEIFGVGSCDHQQPYLPVNWQNVSSYIPSLLKKGLKPRDTLGACFDLCDKHNSHLNIECKDKCQLEYDAIVQPDGIQSSLSKIQVQPPLVQDLNQNKKKHSLSGNILFWTICIIIILVILASLFVLYKKLL
jgi:hypothetical protein